ncbi:flavin reductase family protein [Amycolatopsis sp. NPDC051372]|uniref:flavin reductase family protein n=1 Tax=Amycolatopsis sp. NPDC051372 TaxID=3155669 RepID=UPI003440D2B5
MSVTTGSTGVDGGLFREAMAGVCAPVSIVTTLHDGVAHGTTVSAFASLSADPPLVSVALDTGSRLPARVRLSGRLGINVLTREHAGLALAFAGKGDRQVRQLEWSLDDRLPGAGWLACTVADLVRGGDHVVAFAQATSAVPRLAEPLTYHNRAFGTHLPQQVGREEKA